MNIQKMFTFVEALDHYIEAKIKAAKGETLRYQELAIARDHLGYSLDALLKDPE